MQSHQDELLGQKIDNLATEFKAFKEEIQPLLEAYSSAIFGKKLLVGIATVIGALAVIGGGVISAVNYIRHTT